MCEVENKDITKVCQLCYILDADINKICEKGHKLCKKCKTQSKKCKICNFQKDNPLFCNHEKVQNTAEINIFDNDNDYSENIENIEHYTLTYPVINIENNKKTVEQCGVSPNFAKALCCAICLFIDDQVFSPKEAILFKLPLEVRLYISQLNDTDQLSWKLKLWQCFKNIIIKVSRGEHIKHLLDMQFDNTCASFCSCVGEEYCMNYIIELTTEYYLDNTNEILIDVKNTNSFTVEDMLEDIDFLTTCPCYWFKKF